MEWLLAAAPGGRFEGDLMLGVHAVRPGTPGLVTRARAWLRACVPRLARLRKTADAAAAGAPIGRAEKVLASAWQVNGALVVATGGRFTTKTAPGPAAPGHGWDGRRWIRCYGMTTSTC